SNAFKPDSMICCGGFAAGLIGWVAAKKGVPLFLQEQNSYPGITNRLLGQHAQIIFTAFEDADQYFSPNKTIVAGNPTRDTLSTANRQEALEHFGFTSKRLTLLVLGGSGGARTLNEAMAQNIKAQHDKY